MNAKVAVTVRRNLPALSFAWITSHSMKQVTWRCAVRKPEVLMNYERPRLMAYVLVCQAIK